MSAPTDQPRFIVLYDGTCGFCDASVQWLIRHDQDRRLRYAALQSDYGARIIAQNDAKLRAIDSIVLVETDADPGHAPSDSIRIYSDAALGIAAILPPPWSWAPVLRVIPRGFRDAVYRFIARHRHRIFGRLDSCRLPHPEERALFLS